MAFNWLDIVLLVILGITVIIGIIKGLLRQVIGLFAVIVGLVLALAYYSYTATLFRPLVDKKVVANFLGFLTIFLIVLCMGWLLSRILTKAIKGPLKFINHLLGGGLGLVKGILICGILVFALLIFPVNVKALKGSFLAPYCAQLTKAAIDLIPQDLKQSFREAYREMTRQEGEDVKRI